MGKELLNTLDIAWASIVLLIAGVDTGGDAAEVEAGVVQVHVTMRTWGRMLKDFFVGGGGGEGGHCFYW